MKSILDVPDAALLSAVPLESLVYDFSVQTGVDRPDVVCLPLIDFGGANVASDLLDQNTGPWAGGDFIELAREVIAGGSELYLSVIGPMTFLDAPGMTTRLQSGRESPGICIVNPASQALITACIEEGISVFTKAGVEVSGVILDIVDINGQNANDGRIHFSCFCKACAAALSRVSRFDYRVFSQHPNAANLGLRDNSTGISNFNLDLRYSDHTQLIELSHAYNIYDHEIVGDKGEEWARLLLEYFRARSRITTESVGKIFKPFREKGIQAGAVITNSGFDWTAGTDLWTFSSEHVDQVWLEVADFSPKEVPTGISLYHYLSSRSRYLPDAFFEIVSDLSKLRAIATGQTSAHKPVRALVRDRGSRLIAANNMSKANVSAIRFQEAASGFVGFPISTDAISKLAESCDRIVTEMEPDADDRANTSAKDLVLLLMKLVQQGQPIDMQTLAQIATQLGVIEHHASDGL